MALTTKTEGKKSTMVLTILSRILDLIKYLALGVVQGISEILPISSSGHLLFYKELFGVSTTSNLTFEVLLHFASLIALLWFFRKTLIDLVRGFFGFIFKKETEYKEQFLLVVYIVVATIPVIFVGLFLEDIVAQVFSSLIYVALGFVITSGVLYFVYNLKTPTTEKLNLKKALIVGLAQCIGVLPGVSRSGMTLSTARSQKLDIQKAKEFAFLLFIPVSLGSFILSISDFTMAFDWQMFLNIAAMVSAFVFTYLALVFIFKKLQYAHYKYFSLYCLFMAVMTYVVAL